MTEHEHRVPSLYEWLGGGEVLNALMVKFCERVSVDGLLKPLFGHMSADHPKHVSNFVSEVVGGPGDYTITRGGHANMLAHHFGKNISEAQRRQWVSLLLNSADEVGVPDDPEFRSALVAYLDWGIAAGCDQLETCVGYGRGSGDAHAEVGLGSAGRTGCAGETVVIPGRGEVVMSIL